MEVREIIISVSEDEYKRVQLLLSLNEEGLVKQLIAYGDELANALIEKNQRTQEEKTALSEGWDDLTDKIREVFED